MLPMSYSWYGMELHYDLKLPVWMLKLGTSDRRVPEITRSFVESCKAGLLLELSSSLTNAHVVGDGLTP